MLQYKCLGAASVPSITVVPLAILKSLVCQVVIPCAASGYGPEGLSCSSRARVLSALPLVRLLLVGVVHSGHRIDDASEKRCQR